MKNKPKKEDKNQKEDEKQNEEKIEKVDEKEKIVDDDENTTAGWILIGFLTLLLISSSTYALICPIGLSAVSGEIKVSDILYKKASDLKEDLMNKINISRFSKYFNPKIKEEIKVETTRENQYKPIIIEVDDDDDSNPFKSKTIVPITVDNVLNDKDKSKLKKENVNKENVVNKSNEIDKIEEKKEENIINDKENIKKESDNLKKENIKEIKEQYIEEEEEDDDDDDDYDERDYYGIINRDNYYTIHLSTDKQYYKPAENIFIRGIINNDYNYNITKYYNDGVIGLIIERGSDGKDIYNHYANIGNFTISYVYHIPKDITCGKYLIRVEHVPTVNRTIYIQEYEEPHFITDLKFDKEGYGENDIVSGILKINESGNNDLILLDDVEVTTIIDEKEIKGKGTISVAQVNFELQLPKHIKDNNAVINIKVYYNHHKESIMKTIPILSYELDIRSYVESGSNLINNVKNRIYFECYQKNGNPCDFEGIIAEIDNNNKEIKEIMKIKTIHEGRGKSDYFIAEKDKEYEIRVTKPSSVRTMIKLPKVINGITISSIQPCYDNNENVKMTIDGSTKNGNYLIGLYKKNVLIDIINFNLKNTTMIKFNKNRIGSLVGIFRVTLFNESYYPLNERLIFIKPSHSIKIKIESSKEEYTLDEEVELKIQTIDSITNQPIESEISVTVTDDSVLNLQEKRLHQPSLPSMIYIENEVRHLEDSEIYLNDNENGGEFIDLLLGTQGWRRFLFNCTKCKEYEYYNSLVLNYHSYPSSDLYGLWVKYDMYNNVNDESNQLFQEIEKTLEFSLDNSIRVFAYPPPALSSSSSQLNTIRKYFTSTVYWSVSEHCPKEGKSIKFKLSDSLTTYKVIIDALQWNNNIFGHNEISFNVNKQLKIDFKIPKEINGDDVIGIPVIIESEKLNEKMKMEVEVFGGIIIENKVFEWVQYEKSYKQVVLVKGIYNKQLDIIKDDNDEENMLFNTIKGGVLIKVSNGRESDSIYKGIRIREKGYPQSLSVVTEYSGNQAPISFILSKSTYLESFKMKISFYLKSLTNFLDSLDSLIIKPHGCFEQTSSIVYPMIMVMKCMENNLMVSQLYLKKGTKYLDEGYKLLIKYQTKEGGFEWFGDSPASETLTAYGIMEFEEMKDIHFVDKEMLNKAFDWLMSRIDDKDGYFKTEKNYQFGKAGKECASAYIYWCLSEAKKMTIKDYFIKFSSSINTPKSSSYIIGLLGLTYYNLGLNKESLKMSLLLKNLFQDNHVSDEKQIETITKSYGNSRVIESTSLSLLLFIRLNDNLDLLNKGIEWLNSQNKNGRFGSTQSTILSLKAINEYENRRKKYDFRDVIIESYLNKQIISSEKLSNLTYHSSLYLADYSKLIKHNENKLIIQSNKEFNTSVGLSIFLSFNSEIPESSKDCRVSMIYELSKREIQQGDEVDLRIKVQNKVNEGIGMVVSVVGIPGGLRIRFKELEELIKREVISSYEMKGSELILYWRGLNPNEEKEFVIHSNGEIPGNYKGSVSYIYEYYNDNAKKWLDGLNILIMP